MKKNIISVLSLLLVIVILGNGLILRAEESDTINYESLMNDQTYAVKAYNVLMKSFETEEYGLVYPDEYAGAYVENNKLYIALTDKSNKCIEKYKNLLSDFSCIEYVIANHSMSSLETSLNKVYLALVDCCSLYGCYIDELTNGIVVEVAEGQEKLALSTIDSISKAKTFNIDCNIEVVPSVPIKKESTGIVNGSRFYVNGGGYTLGIGGTYAGMNVIVSAGHGMSYGETATYDGDEIGQVLFSRYESGLPGDFSIIKLNSSDYTYSPLMYTSAGGSTITLQGAVSYLPLGTYVYRYGASSRECYAQITSTNYTTTLNDTNMYKADIITGYSASGDSGGPVRYNSEFCGIHAGSATDDSYIFFTPYHVINGMGFVAFTN